MIFSSFLRTAEPHTAENGKTTASPHDIEAVLARIRDTPGASLYEKKCLLINHQIDSFGMGKYQWCIFFLCGFGYLLDLMWAQAFGLVLSPLEQEFGFSGKWRKILDVKCQCLSPILVLTTRYQYRLSERANCDILLCRSDRRRGVLGYRRRYCWYSIPTLETITIH